MALYDFTSYENVMVCGDLHGHFEVIYNKISVENTLFIVAGDCGFGFNRPAYYEELYSSKTVSLFIKKERFAHRITR